jgi:hypothetical protein
MEELRFASKEEVLEAVEDALHSADALNESGIKVVYEPRDDEMGCTIRLYGEVGSESERQVAMQILTDVLGLPDVENHLFVNEALREEGPGFEKPVRDDTDYMGEGLELLDSGLVNDEFGYTPPDHPIPETTVEEDTGHDH